MLVKLIAWATGWMVLALALATVGWGWPALAEQGQDQPLVLIVDTAEQAPQHGRKLVEKALAELADGHRLQITIGHFFDTGQTHSTESQLPFVQALVPVNADGKPDGVESIYAPRQHLQQTITWKNGIRHGVQKLYNPWPSFVESEIPWENDQVHGLAKSFYREGTLKSETPHVQGRAHGLVKSYAADGTVIRESTMKDGLRDGQLTDYWPETGQPRRRIVYALGKVQGTVREFHPNGQLKREVPFAEDLMHGEEKLFAEDGTPQRSRYWLHGDLVSKTEFEIKFK